MDTQKTPEQETDGWWRRNVLDAPFLVKVAFFLTAASMGWTTWSIVDLLGAGPIGLTVAGTCDLIWAAVSYAAYKGYGPHRRKKDGTVKVQMWATHTIGWGVLLIVIGLLVWHGLEKHNTPMAVAGPLLPLGAKIVWWFAIPSMRDPLAPTQEQAEKLHNLERDSLVQEQQDRILREKAEREHRAKMAELERAHAAKMAEIANRNAEKLAVIASDGEQKRAVEQAVIDQRLAEERLDHQLQIQQLDLQREIRRHTPTYLLQGEVVPQQPQLNAVPAETTRQLAVTVPIDTDMSAAREAQMHLAALWYVSEDSAHAQGQRLTQASFCQRFRITEPSLSKAKRFFPRSSFVTIAEMEEAAQTAMENLKAS